MNLYSAFSLLSAFICVLTGVAVYQRASDKPLYRLFLANSIALCLWCVAGFGLSQADSLKEAGVWVYFFKVWPVAVAISLHFIVYYIGREDLGSKLIFKIALYASAAIVLGIELTTDLVSGTPVLKPWGYALAIPPLSPIVICCYAWFFSCLFLLVYFTLRYGVLSKDATRRKRAKILLLCMIVPIVTSILEAIFYLKSDRLPPISAALSSIMVVGVGYGMWKFDILVLSPLRAAQEIVSTMTDCLLLIDPKGMITTANRAALDLLGYTEQDIKGTPIEFLLPKKDETHHHLLALFDPADGDETSLHDRETLMEHRSGSTVPVSLSGTVLTTPRGKPTGLLLIARDITRRKREEREKKDMEQQLLRTQKIDTIGRLAGGVAHDMNNLLAIIVGAAAVLSDDIESGEATKNQLLETIDTLNAACKRGGELTRNLLGFAREGKYVKQRFHLGDVISQVKGLLDHSAPKQIEIQTRLAGGMSWVVGDRSQIEHAVLNICLNGLDAIDGYGKLQIETDHVFCSGEVDARFGDIETGDYIRIRITDTGRGIEPSLKEKVFEPFVTTKDRTQRAGLGLSMVYGTIRNHKGTVKLDSVLGLGTSVEVYLPTTKGPNVQPAGDEETERISRPSRPAPSCPVQHAAVTAGILLVDDEDMIRRSSERLLKNRGYEVFQARNGVEAVALYREKQEEISLVILDMVMPELDGPGTFHALKEMNSAVKVVLHSGYSKDERVDDLIAAGAKAFVPKPFNPEALFNTITDALKT